jgi:GTPase SAR1 family protein
MKILVLGKANVGKTSLISALASASSSSNQAWGRMPTPRKPAEVSGLSTDGIDIVKMRFCPSKDVLKRNVCPNLNRKSIVQIDVWDFAGQEVYVRFGLYEFSFL